MFNSANYLASLRQYTASVSDGFSEFLQYLTTGDVPTRLLPWGRDNFSSPFDTYLSSVSVLSLLFIVVLLLLIFTYFIIRKKELNKEKQTFFFSAYILTIASLLIFVFVYVGASIIPESTFSDIRTIILIFIFLLLPFFFWSNTLFKYLNNKKFISILFIVLVLIAPLKAAVWLYPLSYDDTVYNVEDRRVATLSRYYAGFFTDNYLPDDVSIVVDYKMSAVCGYYLSSHSYHKSLLSISSLNSSSIAIFDQAGLVYGSPFVSDDAYLHVYNLSLSEYRLYDNGHILIINYWCRLLIG